MSPLDPRHPMFVRSDRRSRQQMQDAGYVYSDGGWIKPPSARSAAPREYISGLFDLFVPSAVLSQGGGAGKALLKSVLQKLKRGEAVASPQGAQSVDTVQEVSQKSIEDVLNDLENMSDTELDTAIQQSDSGVMRGVETGADIPTGDDWPRQGRSVEYFRSLPARGTRESISSVVGREITDLLDDDSIDLLATYMDRQDVDGDSVMRFAEDLSQARLVDEDWMAVLNDAPINNPRYTINRQGRGPTAKQWFKDIPLGVIGVAPSATTAVGYGGTDRTIRTRRHPGFPRPHWQSRRE